MEPITVEELKAEKCPRISAEDLIELGELAGPASSRSPTKKKQNSKPMILIVDVRSSDEYPSLDSYENEGERSGLQVLARHMLKSLFVHVNLVNIFMGESLCYHSCFLTNYQLQKLLTQ